MINRTKHMVVCYERSYKIWTSGWLHLFSEFISRNIWLEGSLHMKYSWWGEKFVPHLYAMPYSSFCNLSNLFVDIHIKCQYMIGSDDESLILGALPPTLPTISMCNNRSFFNIPICYPFYSTKDWIQNYDHIWNIEI